MSRAALSQPAPPDGARAAPARETPWLYVLLALLGTAGFFYVNLAAVIVDGFTGVLGFTNAQAGTVMSANIYGASVGGLIAVFVVRRCPWRTALTGLLAGVLALELASMFVRSYGLMLPLRTLDGLVGGVSVGIALSLLGRTRFPDRAFGVLLVFQFVFGGLGSWLLPGVVAAHGTWVMFACTATMATAALVTAAFVEPGSGDPRAEPERTGPAVPRAMALTAFALVALFLFQASNMGLFAFIIPLGQSFSLGLPFISRTLGWTTWIGTLGALAVIAFGARHGRAHPLLLAMIVTLVGFVGLYWSHYPAVFFLASAATAITWSAVVPYLFGIVSAVDRSGRLATLAGFVSGLGLASGPLFGGWVVGSRDYAPLITLAVMFIIVAGAAAVVSAWRVDRIGVAGTVEET